MAHSSRSAPPLLVRTVRSTHRLEGGTEYRIGRDESADIPVTDPRVSWDHAALYVSGGTWVLEDKGSRNGTYAGSERISRLNIDGPCVIHVGNPEDGPVLRFELEPVPEARPTAPPASAGSSHASAAPPPSAAPAPAPPRPRLLPRAGHRPPHRGRRRSRAGATPTRTRRCPASTASPPRASSC